MDIVYREILSENLIILLDNEFEKHSNKNGLKCNYRFFNFVAKVEDKVAGILKGHSMYDEVIIDELIVFEQYRGQGIGTKLLKKAEEYNKNKDFNYISVFTHEFQAPKFYKKHGFKINFIIENKENPKLTRYFFIKYFDEHI